MSEYILVIDEGTTSTRAICFDQKLKAAATAQKEVPLSLPEADRVEQDGEAIWSNTLEVCREAIAQIGGVEKIAAIGITNQRETSLAWHKETGEALGPAIVWQDRRTAEFCDGLKTQGLEEDIQNETGLICDPYFSASKFRWFLDHNQRAAECAKKDQLAFGTIDAFLIWRLSKGVTHISDASNASRTQLMSLSSGKWSGTMLEIFGIDASTLPQIGPSSGELGLCDAGWFGKALPILSAIGDQQAAMVGQGCLNPGEAKITYGTGAFLIANTGERIAKSENRLLATLGVQTAARRDYALEGSIFNAGTVIKWLRDDLGLISSAAASEEAAQSLNDNGGVYFIPGFTGLGAPHWKANAKGEITGLTRGSTSAHIIRAGLESAAYQTCDLLSAFKGDDASITKLRVDGGMTGNDWLMQFIADICDVQVERPHYQEMTALGAAVLAADKLGWGRLEDWPEQRGAYDVFTPDMSDTKREALLAGWQTAMAKCLQ